MGKTSKSVTIDEAKQSTWIIPSDTDCVHLANSSSEPYDSSKLYDRLSRGSCDSVKRLYIEYTSQMVSIDIIKLFRNLTHLSIGSSRVVDFSAMKDHLTPIDLVFCKCPSKIAVNSLISYGSSLISDIATMCRCVRIVKAIPNFSDLKYVNIQSWSESDLKLLSSLHLDNLSIRSGLLQSTEGVAGMSMQSVFIAECPQLKHLSGVECKMLSIDQCRNVDYSDLAHIKGLRILQLQQQGTIASLAPIAECPNLDDFTVTATKVTADVSVLASSPSIKFIWISPGARNGVRKLVVPA